MWEQGLGLGEVGEEVVTPIQPIITMIERWKTKWVLCQVAGKKAHVQQHRCLESEGNAESLIDKVKRFACIR